MSANLLLSNIATYSLQIGLLVGVAALLPTLLRLRAPAARLAYWHVLLAVCLLLPLVAPRRAQVIEGNVEIAAAPGVVVGSFPAPSAAFRLSLGEATLILLAAGAAIRIGWLLFGFAQLRRYRRRSRPLEPAPSWSVEASLRLSGDVASPVTFGWRRPVILLPDSFPDLSERLRDAILAHECLHVRRRDWLFTLFEELVRAVFWFHPAIWWLLGEIQLAREQAVDRAAVDITNGREEYVDALLAIAGAPVEPDLAPAPLFLRKRHLKQRVFSLIKEVPMSKQRLISALAACLCIMAATCWFVAGTFPLSAAPQVVAEGSEVKVDLGGATLLHRAPVVYGAVISTNLAWNAMNARMAKKPIYALTLSGVDAVFTTHDLALERVGGTLPDYRAWMKTPGGASQSIDVVNGTSSIGELECEVVDQGGFVRRLVGENALCGVTATLLLGWPGIQWNQFVPLHTYVLYKTRPTAGYTSWMFVARDQQWMAKRTVYLHPANALPLSEDNPWILSGTPAQVFQAVALWALGLPAEALDLAQLAALDDPAEGLFAAARPFFFRMTESFEAKQFLEAEIFKPSLLYCVVTAGGKLSLRASRPPADGAAPVFAFTADNMVVLPDVDSLPVINEAVWAFDADGSDFQTRRTYLEATSITTFGRGQQWNVQSKGLRSELGGVWFSEWIAARLFQRFAGTPEGLKGGAPVLQIEAFFATLPVWAGDYVTVTHALMPDVLTGALGVTDRVYEVIDRSPDYASGRMRFKLLDTGLTGAAPAYQWGAGSARPFLLGSSEVY